MSESELHLTRRLRQSTPKDINLSADTSVSGADHDESPKIGLMLTIGLRVVRSVGPGECTRATSVWLALFETMTLRRISLARNGISITYLICELDLTNKNIRGNCARTFKHARQPFEHL